MTKEALKLALEAMEYADACLKKQLTTKDKHEYAQDLLLEAGTAIKEALANEALDRMAENARELGLDYEPAQEPVAWAKFSAKGNIIDLLSEPDDDYTPLYTSPPQRTWVGLTDEELSQIEGTHIGRSFARAIEAALKAKNT
jgi:hypothetical protein